MTTVTSPLAGRAIGLAAVPDPVFSGAMVGPGAAIDPVREPSESVAPVDGIVVSLHPHAFVIVDPDGQGVLTHLGIDTVQLRGRADRRGGPRNGSRAESGKAEEEDTAELRRLTTTRPGGTPRRSSGGESHRLATPARLSARPLNGEGFELLVSKGDTVTRGQAVVRWDPSAVEAAGKSPIFPIVALEATADSLSDVREDGDVKAGDSLFGWQ
jgi:phosphotransferase system IIA component